MSWFCISSVPPPFFGRRAQVPNASESASSNDLNCGLGSPKQTPYLGDNVLISELSIYLPVPPPVRRGDVRQEDRDPTVLRFPSGPLVARVSTLFRNR